MRFEDVLACHIKRCEAALEKAVSDCLQPGSQVSEAARYALLGGGKRVRGVLTLAVCELLGGEAASAAPLAAAVEMVHAFSLIHDDLPCMDDDDMRRGRPATHIAYGEANALLAGDLLALQPFEVIATAPLAAEDALQAVAILAQAAGARGMIYGQELDLYHETHPAGPEALERIQRHKTGALITAAALLGAAAAGRSPGEVEPVRIYAEKLGLVFQVVDDILDVTADEALLGKPVGSDAEQGKQTFAGVFGLQAARERAQALTDEAVAGLAAAYGDAAGFLCGYARQLCGRIY